MSEIIPTLGILNTYISDTNNSIEVLLGDAVSEEVEGFSAQWIQHSGFCSIAPNAVAGKSAPESLVYRSSNRDYVFGSRDVASQKNYGNLNPGEVCLYACGPGGEAQARVMCKSDGSINLYTTDSNDASGKGVYFQVSPSGFYWMAPWGKMIFDKTGFHLKTSTGASLDLGGLGLPGPLAGLSTFCRIGAASVTVDSAAIMLGPAAQGVYMPATYSIIPPASPMQPVPPFTSAISTCVLFGV